MTVSGRVSASEPALFNFMYAAYPGGPVRVELDCAHCLVAQGSFGSGADNMRGYFQYSSESDLAICEICPVGTLS